MSFLEKIREWNKEHDTNKNYPGYFNRIVMRTMAVFMIILAFFVFLSSDFKNEAYIECPISNNVQCLNQFYDCENNPNINNFQQCEILKRFECKDDLCSKQYLQPGEYLGKKPNFFIRNFSSLFIGIMILGFGLNHILFLRNKKVKA